MVGTTWEERLQDIVGVLLACGPTAIYVFGSRAEGDARPDSDLDLAVLLPPGRRLTVMERLALVDRLQDLVGTEVDLVVVNEARLPLQFEIISRGRLVWEADREARTDAQDVIVRDYLDFRPFLERSLRDMVEGAQETSRP
ncbi:MAG: nucleotidyltransferase domain-containing protein [Firmicutes bacterium]|nr:nucleotidyltransferase domain-containing protein [Bacillota bacterium]